MGKLENNWERWENNWERSGNSSERWGNSWERSGSSWVMWDYSWDWLENRTERLGSRRVKWGSKTDSGACSPQGTGARRQEMLVSSWETWHHLGTGCMGLRGLGSPGSQVWETRQGNNQG